MNQHFLCRRQEFKQRGNKMWLGFGWGIIGCAVWLNGCMLGDLHFSGDTKRCDGDILLSCHTENDVEECDETHCMDLYQVGCLERCGWEPACATADSRCIPGSLYVHEMMRFCYSNTRVAICMGDAIGEFYDCNEGERCHEGSCYQLQ